VNLENDTETCAAALRIAGLATALANALAELERREARDDQRDTLREIRAHHALALKGLGLLISRQLGGGR
jgi:hypothetical protein